MNSAPTGDSGSAIGSKRKFDAIESTSDADETDEKECSICIEKIADKDASNACPNSDKHDFHKECLKK